jgi:hypothetical protein
MLQHARVARHRIGPLPAVNGRMRQRIRHAVTIQLRTSSACGRACLRSATILTRAASNQWNVRTNHYLDATVVQKQFHGGLRSTLRSTRCDGRGIDNVKTLQEWFVETRGAPLNLNGMEVVQMDRLPVRRGTVRVTADTARADQGIALKAQSGAIHLSDGKQVPLVHIWFDPGLPLEAVHEVECNDGELRVWNVYRTVHPDGTVTVDAWTGNAGMVVSEKLPRRRRYLCSPGSARIFEPQGRRS